VCKGLIFSSQDERPLYISLSSRAFLFHREICIPSKEQAIFPSENDFSDMIAYFMQLGMVEALAQIKQEDGACPEDVVQVLLDLLHNNDNSRNNVRARRFPLTKHIPVSQNFSRTTPHLNPLPPILPPVFRHNLRCNSSGEPCICR
jgi:hypothetical protein